MPDPGPPPYYPIFPAMRAETWPVTREEQWSTLTQRSASLKEVRIGLAQYPLHEWTLRFGALLERRKYPNLATTPSVGALWSGDSLIGSELRALMGLFNACGGSRDPFLYEDKTDRVAVQDLIGIADGVNTDFQLLRSLGPFVNLEPIQFPSGTPVFAAHWTATTSYNAGLAVIPSIYQAGAYQMKHLFVSGGGTSGATEPFWQQGIGGTIQDGSIVWTENGSPLVVFTNGSPVNPLLYSVLAGGIIRFQAPPAAGTIVTWSGSFRFLCRFSTDNVAFDNIMSGAWTQSGLKFVSVKQ